MLPREVFIQNHTKVLVIADNFKESASTSDVDIDRGGAVGSSWQDEHGLRFIHIHLKPALSEPSV